MNLFQDWGPLPPRAVAAQLGISQEAARQLIRRMVKDGQLQPAEGDSRYRIREGGAEGSDAMASEASGGAEDPQIEQQDTASERHDVTAQRHDVTAERHGAGEGEAVTEQGSPGYPSRIGDGVFVFDAKTGRSLPWRNKALEGPYP